MDRNCLVNSLGVAVAKATDYVMVLTQFYISFLILSSLCAVILCRVSLYCVVLPSW